MAKAAPLPEYDTGAIFGKLARAPNNFYHLYDVYNIVSISVYMIVRARGCVCVCVCLSTYQMYIWAAILPKGGEREREIEKRRPNAGQTAYTILRVYN